MATEQHRTYAVTGSASGIGRATAEILGRRGARVVTIDLHDAEVIADLSTPAGRESLAADVRRASDGALDGIIACAGVGPNASPEAIIGVNYFGAIASLEGLRPLLDTSPAPRAVTVASRAVLRNCDDAIVEACLAGDEQRAVAIARAAETNTYACTKRALARWVRRSAPATGWAGAGIPLNAVAPGAIETPMIEELLQSPERVALEHERMPLRGPGRPEEVAELLVWLASAANSLTTAQVIFIDGGSDAVLRGDDIWTGAE